MTNKFDKVAIIGIIFVVIATPVTIAAVKYSGVQEEKRLEAVADALDMCRVFDEANDNWKQAAINNYLMLKQEPDFNIDGDTKALVEFAGCTSRMAQWMGKQG
jgi:hypothetical protein